MLIPRLTGSFLRKIRAALGLSQTDMALIFGINQTSYLRWEKGTHPVPPGIHAEVEQLYRDFLSDVAALRRGHPIEADAPWREVAMFWAMQSELEPNM